MTDRNSLILAAASSPSPTQAEQELAAVNAAILSILQGKSSSYSLAGRSVTVLDLNTLYQIQGKLSAKIAREQGVPTRAVIRFV